MALAPPSSFRARWAPRLALIGYVGLLATSVLAPGGRAGVAGDLRTGSRVRAVAFALAVYVLLETVRFLPVGILAVLSLPRTRSDRFNMLPVAAVAGAASLLIAVVVLVLEIGPPWQWPGPSDLFLPAVGGVLGVSATLVWLAGRGARRRLLLVLGATLLAAPILAGLVLLAATEREPLVPASPAVTSEEKRRLYDLLRDKDPKALAAGATRSLSLDSFKEELDAGGGSGFSFGDLLADRAGTTFALLATRDDAAARTLQARLAAGFRLDDFFPEAADLPENIQAAELEARYGGVGGRLFRQYAAEVERRLWSCPAYRALAPTAATN